MVFYFLSPIPNLLARRHSDDSASNPCRELALFITTGIVVSAFALPIVLARAPVAADTPPNPPNSTVSNTTTTTVVSFVMTGFPGLTFKFWQIMPGPAFMVTIANIFIFGSLFGLWHGLDDESFY